jgi:hypothetical protein
MSLEEARRSGATGAVDKLVCVLELGCARLHTWWPALVYSMTGLISTDP